MPSFTEILQQVLVDNAVGGDVMVPESVTQYVMRDVANDLEGSYIDRHNLVWPQAQPGSQHRTELPVSSSTRILWSRTTPPTKTATEMQ